MFYWRSEALRNWGRGYIIIEAKDVESARKKAMDRFELDYYSINSYQNETFDEFIKNIQDDEHYIEQRSVFENDISIPPDEREVIFIAGSE